VDTCGGELLVDEEKRGDSVLAVVDGQQIRASDIYRTFFLENPLRTRNALQNEILYILTRKESIRLGVTVGEKEVEEMLARTIEDHRARCAAYIDESVTLEKFVEAQYGMPFDDYRELLRRTAVFNLLLDRCVRFQELTTRQYRLGVIVVDDGEKAAEIRRKLLRGASIEVLAEQHSVDRSAAEGGILTPIPEDERHPLYPLVKSAAHLKEGEVSEVEETTFASRTLYRIVKLIDIIEPVEGSYRDAAAAVQESLEEDPVDLASIQYWQQCQSKRYAVEIQAL
jgi:parvulin-like peptidyl-prolyl isomerase